LFPINAFMLLCSGLTVLMLVTGGASAHTILNIVCLGPDDRWPLR
jgi:hypothetical protein